MKKHDEEISHRVKLVLLHGSFVDGAELKLTACNRISLTLIKGIKLFTSHKLDLIILI